MTERVRVGFLPLLDCAVLVMAQELGFARAEGLDLVLQREVSWSNIRDKLTHGVFDAAHMLAGQPIAATLGLGQPASPMITPLCLGLNGNAVSASRALAAALRDALGGPVPLDEPAHVGRALRTVVDRRAATGAARLRFATVFPFSCHNYELRYWMAACGVDPDRDVELIVVPPPYMADAVRDGEIDAYCVGEPWNSVGVEAGCSEIIALGSRLWQRGVEKVLAFRRPWAEVQGSLVEGLVRACCRAAAWLDQPEGRVEVAKVLAQPRYLDRDAALLLPGLVGRLVAQAGGAAFAQADFLLFERNAATFPWVSQAQWIYSQMVRWGQVSWTPEKQALAAGVFRPDIYRSAMKTVEAILPGASAKVEGALHTPLPVGTAGGRLILGPDRFFDGIQFDPDDIPAYLAKLPKF